MKIKKLPVWVYFIIALLIKTIRILFYRKVVNDPNKYISTEKMPYIVVLWHNRTLFYPLMFSKEHRKLTYAIVSLSRDGNHMSNLTRQLGVNAVRGSSSKNAAGALSESMEIVRKGFNINITPDGPRGPRYKCKQGSIIIASETGRKILPLSVNYTKYWELKNWCKYRIPKPFSRVELVAGEPIFIPPNLSREEIENWCKTVEEAMMKIAKD